jgi:cytoskeletal protein CcmA (bactofilin family)
VANTIGTGTITGTIIQDAGSVLTVTGTVDDDSMADSATLGGTGTLGLVTLAGNNTISSAGTLTTGGLKVNGTGNTIDAGTIVGNADLAASASLEVKGNLAGNIKGASGSILSGSGTVSGAVDITSGNISGNALSLGDTNLHGTSTVSGTTNTNSMTVSDGVTTVSGVATAVNQITVKTGATLTNNGSIAGSSVDVNGTLNGTGAIHGALNIKNLGTLAPGNSPGSTTVYGDLTVENGGTISLQIDKGADTASLSAGGNYDQIVVNGLVDLRSGSVLDFTTLNHVQAGDVFNLLLNDGTDAIIGTFSKIEINGFETEIIDNSFIYGGLEYNLSYIANADGGTGSLGNDITLTVLSVPEPSTWAMIVGGVGMLTLSQRLRRRAA